MSKMRRATAVLAGCLFLGGCNSVPVVVGLVTGSIAGGATANPAVGFAVGVAVSAAADSGIRYYGRRRQQAEQDAIAAVAGSLSVADRGVWKIEHDIPLDDEHGELHVTRLIETPLATCKEIAFSVDESDRPDTTRVWYLTQVCKQGDQWKWASSEPAVERWGSLQ